MQVKRGSDYLVQVSKRVHVSRIVFTPFSAARLPPMNCCTFSARRWCALHSSSGVTAGALVSASTSSSRARIALSCLRAIAVMHY